jgi:hypothetical protein
MRTCPHGVPFERYCSICVGNDDWEQLAVGIILGVGLTLLATIVFALAVR